MTTKYFQTIRAYLDSYAEPVIQGISFSDISPFESIIVIPVYDEPIDKLETFLDFHNGRKTVMVWVFNVPDSARSQASHERTQSVFKQLLEKTSACRLNETLFLSRVSDSLSVLFVDQCRTALLPAKQGVGLARKLGMDIALKLVYEQAGMTSNSVPWIYSTDADVQLPGDYGRLPPENAVSACVYPFQHIPEKGFERAMKEYEFSLHYYVQSLKYAGSLYAFHTIGSLIAVSPLAYAQVRGFPKRSGAEDFYLLNKLQKVGTVSTLSSPKVIIAGRPSQRVPFGTGPALIKIESLHSNNESLRVYHPRIFEILKQLLECVAELKHRNSNAEVLFSALALKLRDCNELNEVIKILQDFALDKQFKHLRQQNTHERFQLAFHTWFDAFLTLRFVHELRDRLYPSVELQALPALLADLRVQEAMRGTDFDYIEWFDVLGISG